MYRYSDHIVGTWFIYLFIYYWPIYIHIYIYILYNIYILYIYTYIYLYMYIYLFCFKGVMVFSKIEYSSAKNFKWKHSIRKKNTKNSIWESHFSCTSAATVLAGVEETNLRRGIWKSFGNFEKNLGWQEKIVQGTGKFEISKFKIPIVFCFDQVLNDKWIG